MTDRWEYWKLYVFSEEMPWLGADHVTYRASSAVIGRYRKQTVQTCHMRVSKKVAGAKEEEFALFARYLGSRM
jgi:hypothetical protein